MFNIVISEKLTRRKCLNKHSVIVISINFPVNARNFEI